MKNVLFTGIFFLLLVGSVSGQSTALGIWKSIDDKTGEAKSNVEIYERNGKVYGKIVKILTDKPDAKCIECKGEKHNQPVLGLQVIEGLVKVDGEYKSGTILDPENGNTYGCSIWLAEGDPNQLKLRGKHWTGIYRTQTWYRVK
jgi:uncharacterized protein (DUF2147 family)